MNWIGFLSFLLAIGTLISSICLIPAISYYQQSTGFKNIDFSLNLINYFSIFISIAIIVILKYIIKTWDKIISFTCIFILIMSSLFEFYHGLFLFYDSKAFISSFFNKWFKNIETPYISEIESKFNCCYFHYIRQFHNSHCNSSIKEPCLQVISSTIKEPIEAIGSTFIFHALIHGLIAFLLYIINENRKDKIDYNPSEWINERLDNYQEPTYK